MKYNIALWFWRKKQTFTSLSGRSFMQRLICQRVCCGSLRCTSLWRALFVTILAGLNIPVQEDCGVVEQNVCVEYLPHTAVIVKMDICHLGKMCLAKLFHQPGFPTCLAPWRSNGFLPGAFFHSMSYCKAFLFIINPFVVSMQIQHELAKKRGKVL